MSDDLRVALIGLDTSHAIEFARRMAAPDCREELRVPGFRAVSCLRFPSRYQSEPDQDKRQEKLEGWGIPVTSDLETAVRDADALILTVNDATLHRTYVEQCVKFRKPIFLDKPPADSVRNLRAIYRLARKKKVPLFSASALRFVPMLAEACQAVPTPRFTHIYGAIGNAPDGIPEGEVIIWYGVHAVEMLQVAMGRGALSVSTRKDAAGYTLAVEYPEGRRGVVELSLGAWLYGGELRMPDAATPFIVKVPQMVHDAPSGLLKVVREFFRTGQPPVAEEDTLEVMELLEAAVRSLPTGRYKPVPR